MRCRGRVVLALWLVVDGTAGACAATPPRGTDAVVFRSGDWLGACDNMRDCTLFGFTDDDAAVLMLRLPRGRPASGALLLRPDHPVRADVVHLQPGRRGAVLPLKTVAARSGQARAAIDAASVGVLLPLIRQGGRLTASVPPARPQNRWSVAATMRLAGASVVLDWIDRTRSRLPSQPGPVAGALVLSAQPPPTVLPAGIAAMPAVRACSRLDSGQPGQGPSATALSGRAVLWRIACGSGNFSQDSLFLLAEGSRAAPAVFDSPVQFPNRPPGILANAELDGVGGLTATEPFRGLEDCGDVRRYRWDGIRFRLVGAQLMPACHGLAVEDWPVVYRTTHDDPSP